MNLLFRRIPSLCFLQTLFVALSFLWSAPTFGQSTVFRNSIDDSLSIKTITVAPMGDNVSQIYGQPLTAQLRNIVENDRQWDIKTFPAGMKSSLEEFEDNPESVKAILRKAGSDALLAGRLTKGPGGISIKLDLFLAKDGLLLAQESLQNHPGFEISDLRSQLENLYNKLKSRMPYAGTVLSRKNRQVTVNLGTLQGLKEQSELSVIQIIKVNRHPRFKFIVSSEKEIIGRIRIDKAEESLSFGTLLMERTENAVLPGMKIIPVDFVVYPAKIRTGDGKLSDLSLRPDSDIALGENPKEWVPKDSPSLGKFSLMLGLGHYAVNNTLQTVGAVNGSHFPTPSVHLDGELWLTTSWFMSLGLKQYILAVSNPYSSPGQVNVSSSQTSLQFGYNFLLQDEFFGPKFQVLGGYTQFASTVDTSSPTAYTSMTFNGLAVGIAGSFPVMEEIPITLGAKLLYHLSANVAESPVTSGSSSKAQISSFSIFGSYRWSEHIHLRSELIYDLFSASFSGGGSRSPNASSASHALTTFAGGFEYLF